MTDLEVFRLSAGMTHIDDWLDERWAKPPTDEGEKFAVEFLEHFRRPAIQKDLKWLAEHPLFCDYKGRRYRCIGCSRMGDVWLTEHFERVNGYDLRVDVAGCSNWGSKP